MKQVALCINENGYERETLTVAGLIDLLSKYEMNTPVVYTWEGQVILSRPDQLSLDGKEDLPQTFNGTIKHDSILSIDCEH